MIRPAATLKDIAERTGVSKVTVSYVLNGRETRVRISDSTRSRVLETAKELGYQPNYAARALARKCTDTVTLVMQSPNVFTSGSGFINEMMHGVLDAANLLGYDLLLHTKNLPGIAEDFVALTDGRADGLLILRDLGDPLVTALAQRGTPCVSIFSRSDVPGAWYVDCDNVAGGFLATEHLIKLGHRRIVYVGGAEGSSPVRDRYQGYADAHAAHGLPFDPSLRCEMRSPVSDADAVLAMMRRPHDRPTALFCWSDDVAVQTIMALRDVLGLRVPRDVSVVGFDGTPLLCGYSAPPLTSVRQPIYTIAERAMQLLVARIRKQETRETQILLAPEMLVQQSSGPPPPVI